jgi:predicted phosphodiesterase
MKIAIASDIHLEFGDLDIQNTDHADVLILSGDICVAKDIAQRDPHNIMGAEYRSNRYHNFFQQCGEKFSHVIYIVGNHEHYNGDFAKTIPHLKDVLGYIKNLHILEREVLTIDDVTFIGGTLWTDMNQRDETTLLHMKGMMNDFICVSNSLREVNFRDQDGNFRTRTAKFSPKDAVEEHEKFFGYIKQVVEDKTGQKFVVVGHHAPSRLSTHPKYAHDTIMNGGYSSSLDEYILDHPQIKLWTHGHTHEDFDYMLGSTRIVCNPRGYINYESRADTWDLKYVNV